MRSPTRYLNEIRPGRANNELVPTVARIIRGPAHGWGSSRQLGRQDRMVETRIVLDESKPYHLLSSEKPANSLDSDYATLTPRSRRCEAERARAYPRQRAAFAPRDARSMTLAASGR